MFYWDNEVNKTQLLVRLILVEEIWESPIEMPDWKVTEKIYINIILTINILNFKSFNECGN